jgi:hypothetical protein
MTPSDPAPAQRLERRRAPRIPMPPHGGAVAVVGARLLNVSRYGMLIESPLPMARDTVMRLRVLVAGQPADLEARVAVCTPQPGLRCYGVGLEFSHLGDGDRERLERVLAAYRD